MYGRSLAKVSKYLIVVVSLFLLNLLILISAFTIFSVHSDTKIENNESFVYQTVSYMKKSKISLMGMVSYTQEIVKDEYLFFEQDDGFHLVSELGSVEYICTGSCYCVDAEDMKEERRSISTTGKVVKNGLVFLLTSIASIAAYDKAKDFFDEKCKEESHFLCPSGIIQSDVDECSPVADSDNNFRSKEYEEAINSDTTPHYLLNDEGSGKVSQSSNPSEASKTKVKIKGPIWRKWFCKGSCAPNPNISRKHIKLSAVRFGCEEMETSITITIDEAKLMESKDGLVKEVARIYWRERLNPYCVRFSPYREARINLCMGGFYHQVRCRRVEEGKTTKK